MLSVSTHKPFYLHNYVHMRLHLMYILICACCLQYSEKYCIHEWWRVLYQGKHWKNIVWAKCIICFILGNIIINKFGADTSKRHIKDLIKENEVLKSNFYLLWPQRWALGTFNQAQELMKNLYHVELKQNCFYSHIIYNVKCMSWVSYCHCWTLYP
jgi:hypothetical protein